MKTLIITLIAVGTLAGTGCQTNKLLGRQSDRSTSFYQESEIAQFNRQQALLHTNDRIDSAAHEFSISIVDADTFHFSPAEGFSGTAARIVLTGRSSGTVRSVVKTAAASSTGKSNITSNAGKVESEKSDKIRTVEARTVNSALVILCIVIFLLALLAHFLYRRAKINHVLNS